MSLSAGTRLGPYEVIAPAGAGGMGEVYRARDTRLGRDVAIKVLPARLAADPEFRQRLDREARAVSSLSHPNICTLYDVGHQEGVDFLVMEYLDGETLAARLTRGALPPDQVLRYGIEIADGLAAAHRRGIVHRDLKPGNIMLTRTGARLLDFGLAKPAIQAADPAADLTISRPITTQGTLIGTFQYMAPEQVEGKEADARSDVFALGAVLYEMATGTRAFDGKTTASVIAAILERDPPPIATLQPLVPAALDDVVRGCLAKDPEERWQTAHDVKLQLQLLRKRAAEPGVPQPSARRGWTGRVVPWAIAALAVAALAVMSSLPRGDVSAPSIPVVRASVLPPPAHSFTPNDFAISPDGRRVAFVAAGADGVATLWISSVESSQAAEVAGSEGAQSPFWSPDSRWIGFFANARLLKVEPGGMGVQSVTEVFPTARGGAWSQDDVILFSNTVFGPLVRVSANGGPVEPVTSIPKEMPGEAHRFPQFLPDGRRFIYFASWTSAPRTGLYLGRLDGGEPTMISAEIRSRTVLANGHLLYISGGALMAQPFDTAAGRTTGAPHALVRNEMSWDWRFGEMPLSASQNGILLYQSRQSYNSHLAWFDRSGRQIEVVGPPGFSAPELSPDDRRVAVAHDAGATGQTNIWVHDLQRNIQTQLTTSGTDTALAWSGDGRWIAYTSLRSTPGLFRRPADGSGPEEALYESGAHLLANSYSPDGRRLLFMDFGKGFPELRAIDTETREVALIDIGAEGAFSPDGRWLAYLTYPGGVLMVRRTDGGGRVQVSRGPGSQARWRADMKELFYIAPDKKMMSVPIAMRGDVAEPGTPVPLFQTRIIQPRLVLFQYDVTADGQRFLINSLPREDSAAPLTLLVNWMAEPSR